MEAIVTERQYQKTLKEVYELMNRSEEKTTSAQAKAIHEKALLIQAYEQKHYPFPMPESITDIVELKMVEQKITQTKLAEILNIGTAKLSQILSGKRKPDVSFLKAVHEKLSIDGNFLLEKV